MPILPENVLEVSKDGTPQGLPRGLRNNNPGNIRHGSAWQGLCDEQNDGSFCQFKTPEYGIRAMTKILRDTYYHKRGLNTVNEIIDRWAPPTENDTRAYQAAVAGALGVEVDWPIDLDKPMTLLGLLGAIIRHENGVQPYTSTQILGGMRMP